MCKPEKEGFFIKKNDIYEIEIYAISAEGQGVGQVDGRVMFIPETVPGDFVRARIEKVAKNHGYAKAVGIITPSEYRVGQDCPVYPRCGGCSLRHMSYAAELSAKQSIITEALRRIGGVVVDALKVLPSPMEAEYRNKAILPFQGEASRVELGFYAKRSHRLVSVGNCELCPAVFARIQHEVLVFVNQRKITAYDETTNTGLLRQLYIRRGERTGEIGVTFVINGNSLPDESVLAGKLSAKFPSIVSVMINSHTKKGNANLGRHWRILRGRDYIYDEMCGLRLKIGAEAFYQVNTLAAEVLYDEAFKMADLRPGERVLDLYCGIGSIGLSFAKKRADIQITGVEIVKSAVENAAANALENGINNAEFVRADLGDDGHVDMRGFDTVVVDPPRSGLDVPVISALALAKPEKILYISCNPATLARDMAALREHGYEMADVLAVDLFPRTHHVEAIALLRRVNA